MDHRGKRVKIGILTIEEFAFRLYGGFGFVARKTASLLRHLGYDVSIIDCGSQHKGNLEFLDGIPVHFLLNRTVRLGPIEESLIAKAFLKKTSFDIVIAICVSSNCGKWVYYFKRASPEVKSLIWFQDVRTVDDWKKILRIPLPGCGPGSPFFFQHERYSNFIRMMAIRKADGLITQAQLINPKIKKLYKTENVSLVSNPIPIPEEKDIRKQDEPLVVFLGRIDPIKRPWIYARIAMNLPDIQFLVLGTTHFPAIMDQVMEKYKKIENLKFLGLTVGKQKEEILSRAWVLVNTSIYESLPVSFLEALSYKMAILSCQNPDSITSRYGFYTGEPFGFGFHETQRFVSGLQYLLSSARWMEKGEKGYEFVKDFADERKIAGKLDKILNRLE